jgi:hypothetical protein
MASHSLRCLLSDLPSLHRVTPGEYGFASSDGNPGTNGAIKNSQRSRQLSAKSRVCKPLTHCSRGPLPRPFVGDILERPGSTPPATSAGLGGSAAPSGDGKTQASASKLILQRLSHCGLTSPGGAADPPPARATALGPNWTTPWPFFQPPPSQLLAKKSLLFHYAI